MNAYFGQYHNNQVTTASPEQLLIMMYDGALRFVRRAEGAMAAGDRLGKLEAISRAMAVIAELANTLDHQVGGEIAENLDGLYNFMLRELTQANLKNDEKKLAVVANLLSGLRETWIEAIELARAEKAGQGQAVVPQTGKAASPAPVADHRPLKVAL